MEGLMPQLKFQAADLIRVVDHALRTKADLVLVHDQGVYLMSGGLPRDLDERYSGPAEKSYVAYAQGCNPAVEGWWERSRALVGGDDFGEPIPWAAPIKEQIDRGAPYVCFSFSPKRLTLLACRGAKQGVK
jgi:hypothetical protein